MKKIVWLSLIFVVVLGSVFTINRQFSSLNQNEMVSIKDQALVETTKTAINQPNAPVLDFVFHVSRSNNHVIIDKSGIAECHGKVEYPCPEIKLTTDPALGFNQNVTKESGTKAPAQMPTQSPAWLVLQVELLDPTSTMKYSYQFLKEGEGLLQIYADTALLGTIDQRFVPAVSSKPKELFLGNLEPGIHKIAFRLDGYGANPSEILITGIELGKISYEVVE